MNSTLTFAPIIPLWLLLTSAVLALGMGLFYLWRTPRSALFRIGALATLLGLLANPQLQTDEHTPLSDIVVVITDASASQTLDNREEISTQINRQLQSRITQLGDVDIQDVLIDASQETPVIDTIRSTLADIPRDQLAGLFIITDGQATDITLDEEGNALLPIDVKSLLPTGVPAHILLTGHPEERDRRISLINAPRYGIVRESVRVSFRIDDLGPDNTEFNTNVQVPVSLKVDGKEILRQPVPTGQNVGFDVPLERPGQIIIELSVSELEGELSDANNSVVLPITAVRDRLRVLLISGEPNPGERVWRNLLKSDPSIDMVHFTILRTADKFDAAPPNELALIPFPTNELFIEKLKEFDLIIFDRYTWRNVLKSYHFDNIARFVEEGGAMLVASGPEYNGRLSLARRRTISYLLPSLPMTGTIEEPFRPVLSDAGKRHPVTADLPDQGFWGRWLRAIPTQVRRGTALMAGPADVPLLILDRVGKGRVGMIQSDHIWLWARGFDGGGPHAELLRRTAHWLMKEPQLEEERLNLSADQDSLIIERRSLSDSPSPTTITLPDGSTQIVEMAPLRPGIFQAVLSGLPPGLYRAEADDLFAIGAIGLATAPEFRDVVSESRKLSPISDATGGGLFKARRNETTLNVPSIRYSRLFSRTDAQRSGPGWAGIVRNDASQIDGRRNTPLAPPWAWLMVIALLLGLAWLLESRPLTNQGND